MKCAKKACIGRIGGSLSINSNAARGTAHALKNSHAMTQNMGTRIGNEYPTI